MGAINRVDLRGLAERIRTIERKSSVPAAAFPALADREALPVVFTGWTEIDAAIGGGLVRGALHEWFGLSDAATTDAPKRRDSWSPPLALVVHLAGRAVEDGLDHAWAVWIGRRSFPYPHALVRANGADPRLLERSIFVSAGDADARLWAMDLAIRCPAVRVVIADGSQFAMPATRRLQLLARNHDTLTVCVRPPVEKTMLSAAQTRWLVTRTPSDANSQSPRWSVELLRCKGSQPVTGCPAWTLEWNHVAGVVGVPASMADSAGQTPIGARVRRA